MARARNPENRGLPLRWRKAHGAYYYQVPPGLEAMWDGKKMFRLGTRLNDAYKVWADRVGRIDSAKTIADLLDRYLLEVVPTKAKATQITNRLYIAKLREVFGERPLLPLEPQLIYQYIDRRSIKKTEVVKNENTGKEHRRVTGGRVVAYREIEVLSHAYTKAVQWGFISQHPFKGEMELEGEKPRNRYVEDWEIVECLALPSVRKRGSVLMIQAYLRLKLLTGMSQGDLLRLEPARHFTDEGIFIQRHKTENSSGKRTIYEWTPELRKAVRMALRSRPVDSSPFLFCNRSGKGYIDEEKANASGWKSMWQRFMDRVIAETKVCEKFTEHDLRAKVASDADTLEHARALLSHADARTTRRVYRRKPELVAPLR